MTLLRGGQQTGAAIVGERTVLPVGSYAVRLEMEGGEAVEAYVRVVSSQVARVRLVAPPPRVARGRILVRAEGVRAEVRVNGELRGTTPLAIPAVPAGRYRVDLSREGYVPWSGEIVVREDRSTYVDVTLVPRAGG
ncbi:MAG: PEGA domain-containing protein [Sandaracinaceae bacterium]|nr:PEGA domain-containing protein [Sandaracinaceae bacterium]